MTLQTIFDKILRGQNLAEAERYSLLDWVARTESFASSVNPMTGQTTPATPPAEIRAMIEQALRDRQVINRLSEITPQMGLLIAGEFRTGNSKTPGDGFTGGRFGWPGFDYGGTEYFLAGVEDDVLQVGLSLADGRVYAGEGNVVLTDAGIVIKSGDGTQSFLSFYNSTGTTEQFAFKTTSGNMQVQNLVAGASTLFKVKMTDGTFPYLILEENPGTDNQLLFQLEEGAAGLRAAFGSDHFIDALPTDGSGSATVWFNERGHDIDFVIKDVNNVQALKVDAGAGTVSIYGTAVHPPVVENNSNDIFRVNTTGSSAFAGTIATLPGGAVLTYNVTSGNEEAMVPASTSQLAKLRLYNTTRGTSALISNTVIGTNTITLTANVPAGWALTDVITIASQTVSDGTGNWVDLELTSGPTGKAALFLNVQWTDTGVVASTTIARIHPFETFGTGKIFAVPAQVSGFTSAAAIPVKLTSDVFTVSWIASGAGTGQLTIREMGYYA